MRNLMVLLALGSAIAWGQNCGLDSPTVKPVTPPGCQDTARACICSGSSCRWQWACVGQTVSNGNTSDPLQVFTNAPAAPQPLDVGAYMRNAEEQRARIDALNAQTAAIMASPEMQVYLRDIAARRQQAFDLQWKRINELADSHDYREAIKITKSALRDFPRNDSLSHRLKELKQSAKDERRAAERLQTEPR